MAFHKRGNFGFNAAQEIITHLNVHHKRRRCRVYARELLVDAHAAIQGIEVREIHP